VYSEPLNFVRNTQHTEFLIDFLTKFIANPEHRGKDPTVTEGDAVYIRHADRIWAEQPIPLLCYRPCIIGRNIRVAVVKHQDANANSLPGPMLVMKSTWEENLPPESSPPSEVEVLKILLKANVRGLPMPYHLDSAVVRDSGDLEMETRSFPENCEVALQAASIQHMKKMETGFASSYASKHLAPNANVSNPLLHQVRVEREDFNQLLEVRR